MAGRRVGEAEKRKKYALWFMRNRRTRLIR
jgi:hypothetical protein